MRYSKGDRGSQRRSILASALLAGTILANNTAAAQDTPTAPATSAEVVEERAPAPLGPVVPPEPAVDPEEWTIYVPNPESDYELPDPLTFDVETTTYTELEWVRTDLFRQHFQAVLVDVAAASQLAEARALVAAAVADRDAAQLHLDVLTSGLQAAAIDGYLNDNSSQATDLFAPNLETLGNADLSAFTTSQLIAARDQAQEELIEAEAALDQAEAAEGRAAVIKAATAIAIEELASLNVDFEERADIHSRTDRSADLSADALDPEVDLGSVIGLFRVHQELEPALDALIAHARVDGITLGGGGYRTIESQIELRLAHCGGATPPSMAAPGDDASEEDLAAFEAASEAWRNYVIYEVPAGSCSPPTAVPGNSQHQLGLAVDFSGADGSILTWQSPEFDWLVRNGADFGMINLPSEAWHWSTTGH